MDYIYFRIYHFYAKKKDDPIFTGILFLTVIYIALFFFLMCFLNLLTNDFFTSHNKEFPRTAFKNISYALLFTFGLFNFFRYSNKKRRDDILNRYKSSPKNKTIKTWQIFVLPIVICVLAVIMMKIFR